MFPSGSLRLPGYDEPRRVRRRAWWHRAWGLLAVLLGSILVLGSILGLAAVPDEMRQERAFLAAVPCAQAGNSVPRADCLRSVGARVVKTVIDDRGRDTQYRLVLSGPAPASGSLDMGDAEPLLKRLRPGDEVTVTVWRDYATAVSRGGRTQETADTPLDEPQFDTALALALLSMGTFVVYAGGCGLLRAHRFARHGLPSSLVPLGKGSIMAAFFAIPALAFGTWRGGPVTVAVAWLALLPAAGWVVVALERRARRRARHRTN